MHALFALYICLHAIYIHCNVCRYVEYHGIQKLFKLYREDVVKASEALLSESYFYKLWRKVMNRGVVDPETGTKFLTFVRINHCRGFAQCTTCEILSADMARATDDDEKACFARALAEHRAEVVGPCVLSIYLCCLLYTSPSPRDRQKSRMPSSA